MEVHVQNRAAAEIIETAVSAITGGLSRLLLPGGQVEQASIRSSLETFLAADARAVATLQGRATELPTPLQIHAQFLTTSPKLLVRLRARADCWTVAVQDMLNRLDDDWDRIRRHFNFSVAPHVLSLSEPLGDLHNHGRSVFRLRSNHGQAIIYKPRPVDAENALGAMLSWLADGGCEPTHRHCIVLPRSDYGWTSYVDTIACSSPSEADRFYKRQGSYLAMFWLIGADDLVTDNVVVNGEYPIWVDNECICHPEVACAVPATAGVPDWIRHSVLASGMVFWGKNPRLGPRHLTGLSLSCSTPRSRIFTAADVLKPRYIDAVAQGFRDTYTWFLANDEARSPSGFLSSLWRHPTARVLLRPTSLYADLEVILSLAPPKSEAAARSTVASVLRSGEGSENGVTSWPDSIVDGELAALERGDVPYWTAHATSHDMREAGGDVAAGVLSRSGLECMNERAATMSERNLELQTWLLRSFLGAN